MPTSLVTDETQQSSSKALYHPIDQSRAHGCVGIFNHAFRKCLPSVYHIQGRRGYKSGNCFVQHSLWVSERKITTGSFAYASLLHPIVSETKKATVPGGAILLLASLVSTPFFWCPLLPLQLLASAVPIIHLPMHWLPRQLFHLPSLCRLAPPLLPSFQNVAHITASQGFSVLTTLYKTKVHLPPAFCPVIYSSFIIHGSA